MNKQELKEKWASLRPWKGNYGEDMEYRGADGVSWYDLSVNVNSLPCEPELCIIVTAWYGQLKWLRAALESYKKSGAFVILAYDKQFYPWMAVTQADILRCMPNMKHYMLADAFVLKHLTADGNKRNGWFWNTRYAQGIVRQFPNIKYVYQTNGDCIIEKPEGFKDLIELLGDADLMSGQSTDSVIHSADMIFKVNAYHAIVDWMYEQMRVPVIGSHSPEVMLREAVQELGIKLKHAPKQPRDPNDNSVDCYARYDNDSTWKDILGFKNIFAIYETCGNEGKEMMFLKPYVDNYLDWLYWAGEERETICKYWETGDRRYLMQFWDRWEDSDYNRWYPKLEWYGKEPIYERENGQEAAPSHAQA